ncbi:MAG: hypothetical protein FRX49_12575 [Trebouxia sp. A1-2]|nr:MAG: hypothetical protein FRX49_12575 [Trebouxia sp. A1-2]
MHDTARALASSRALAKHAQGIQKEQGQGKLVQLSPVRQYVIATWTPQGTPGGFTKHFLCAASADNTKEASVAI